MRGPERGYRLLSLALAWFAIPCAPASSIDVLWYSYALDGSAYKTYLADLADGADDWSEGSGISWELSYFGPADPTPSFPDYDVLVIHGGESQWTVSPQPDVVNRVTPDFSGILDNKAAIENARGERTFISGSDADFHAARGDTGHTAQFIPDYNQWDGAIGYAINSINWAAAGAGLGIVSWYHGEHGPNAYWWQQENSFLKDELAGYVLDFKKDLGFAQRDNFPAISAGTENYLLNAGLTADGSSASIEGLENWQWSFHGGFATAIPGYTGLQDSSKHPGYHVSIASSAFASQGVESPLAGDANANGFLDAGDTLLCSRIILGQLQGTAAQRIRCDVAPLDGDGIARPDGQLNAGDLLVSLKLTNQAAPAAAASLPAFTASANNPGPQPHISPSVSRILKRRQQRMRQP